MNVHSGTQPSYLHLALGWTILSNSGPSVFFSQLIFPPQGIIQNVLFVLSSFAQLLSIGSSILHIEFLFFVLMRNILL